MHICILPYTHVTVLYYILGSFQKNKMLILMLAKQPNKYLGRYHTTYEHTNTFTNCKLWLLTYESIYPTIIIHSCSQSLLVYIYLIYSNIFPIFLGKEE